MTAIVRRLRGIAATALTWAAAWTAIGAAFRVVWPTESGLGPPTVAMIVSSGIGWALPGAIAGTVFALLLTADGGRRIRDLSLKRVAIWGFVGALLLPLVEVGGGSLFFGRSFSWVLPLLAQFAVAGALCSIGSVALARRGDGEQQQRLVSP